MVGIGGLVVGSSVSAGVGALALAGYLYRHRESPGVPWFILSALAVALWCLTYGMALLVAGLPLRESLTALWLFGAIWTGPLFLLFSLAYTGRTAHPRSQPGLAVLAIPTVGSGLLLTHTAHTLFWTDFHIEPMFGLSTASYTLQPMAYLVTSFTLVSAGVAVLLLVETVVSYGPLYRGEAIALALSVVPPAAGSLPWLFGFGPFPQLNLSPALFLLHLTLDGYAFVEKDMFETNPTTRRAAERSAIDDIPTPLFALDSEDRVVTVNDAAIESFSLDRAAVLGEPLDGVVPIETGADGAFESVTITSVGGERQFTVATAPLTDPAETEVGRTVVCQEVTQEREREQRLSVLNRVIRHNLRNEMTVILGHAELVAARTEDPDLATSAGRITGSAERLLATGDKAREFERIRGNQTGAKQVDVAKLVADVAAGLDTEYPGATVEVDMGAGITTRRTTDPSVLSLVVTSLVENAIAHNDTDTPRVRISFTERTGALDIRINDNGPGIDAHELAPLENGVETDLEHSTGIGLWVASWGVKMLGGELEFTDTSDGTEVVVSLSGDGQHGPESRGDL